MIKVAVLDDYQNAFSQIINIEKYKDNFEFKVFNEPFADEKEANTNLLDNDNQDELYNSALEIIKSEGKASTSFLQRKLQIGYNRAARIIDQMETNGEVSKANHVGKREVLK